jgi:hypothetical protein
MEYDYPPKGVHMSRRAKFISLTVLVLFILACSTVTQPFNQARDLAGTAQAIATAMPIQTLQSLATQISSQVPVETFEALPSMMPSLEALATKMPDFEGFFNPQGTPVSEWNGIPVMPKATAGQEFKDSKTYSFKVNATVKDAQDFYKAELEKLGWSSTFNMPGNENVVVQMFQKDNDLLTVTITNVNGSVVVVLTMA